MAIQLRRGNEADLDISRLQPGETAVCLDTGKIIVKLTGGNYLTLTDTDAIQEIVAGKAAASHTHVKSDVTDLTNVKPDWNAASGSDAEILNKPTIPSYSNATASASGLMSAADKAKIDGIESGAEANVQSDWNQSDTTADDFIKNKPDLSVYAPATFDDVGGGSMSYNNIVSNGTTYPNTVTLKKNAKNYRLLLVRYYVTTIGGVQLWDFTLLPSPHVTTVSTLLKTFDLSGGTSTEYIFGLQFSLDGTTMTLSYGVNNIKMYIQVWGIK